MLRTISRMSPPADGGRQYVTIPLSMLPVIGDHMTGDASIQHTETASNVIANAAASTTTNRQPSASASGGSGGSAGGGRSHNSPSVIKKARKASMSPIQMVIKEEHMD